MSNWKLMFNNFRVRSIWWIAFCGSFMCITASVLLTSALGLVGIFELMLTSQQGGATWRSAGLRNGSEATHGESTEWARRVVNVPRVNTLGVKPLINWLKNFLGGTSGKNPACQCRRHKRHGFNLWVRKIPWRRAWQPIPVFLPGESHEQRSLVDYSP